VAKLIYSALMSLDGYVADEDGNFDWARPSEEVHVFVNDLERPVGTHLYGRRLYEVMAYWETAPAEDASAEMRDYAELWRAADKVVYSGTLDRVTTARTRLERSFEPDAVRALKATASRDLTVGGAGLAAEAFRAGLVDEIRLIFAPAIVGGGTRALPDDIRIGLELVDERRFAGGMVYVRYRVTG